MKVFQPVKVTVVWHEVVIVMMKTPVSIRRQTEIVDGLANNCDGVVDSSLTGVNSQLIPPEDGL